jgi:hypothetical protein
VKRFPGRASKTFARTEQGQEYLFEIALVAKTFGQRPSKLLGLVEPAFSLNFDLAAALLLHQRMSDARGEFEPQVVVKKEVISSENFSDFATRLGGFG